MFAVTDYRTPFWSQMGYGLAGIGLVGGIALVIGAFVGSELGAFDAMERSACLQIGFGSIASAMPVGTLAAILAELEKSHLRVAAAHGVDSTIHARPE